MDRSLLRASSELGIGPPLTPGRELARQVAVALRESKPGWWIGPIPDANFRLGVPNATLFRFWEGGGRADVGLPVKPLGDVLPPGCRASPGS